MRHLIPRQQLRTRLRKAGKETGSCLKKAAIWTCKCALYTICAPCLCCALLCLPRRAYSDARCRYVEPERPALPTPRRRALSLPLAEAQDDQGTVEQPHSYFMTKLPLELRRMIYQHALGGTSVHLMSLGGKPFARRCGLANCQCSYFDPTQEKTLDFGLSLLRTCRVIYSEAVEYLYKGNDFSLSTQNDEIPTINYISYYLLPQRLAQIRVLRMHWELDSQPYYLMEDMSDPMLDPWYKSWDALTKLTGLQRLHIDMVFRYNSRRDYEQLWKARGTMLLEPIKRVTAPREFVIMLPDPRCAVDVDVGESKCVIKVAGWPNSSSDAGD